MSITHEQPVQPLAAELIADALVNEAAGATGHRRIVLRSYLEVPPSAVFAALAERFDDAFTVAAGGESVQLNAIRLADGQATEKAILIPYLVTDSPSGSNMGTAGFAAYLRDEVPTGEGRRILLILDPSPVETVRTAADDASELGALGWNRLARAAVAGATETVGDLLAGVLKHDAAFARLPRTATTLGALKQLAGESDATVAGRNLHILGTFLSDPDAALKPQVRLRQSANWRRMLQDWLAPAKDFEGELSRRYADQHHPGLDRVVKARTPFGLDFGSFTLNDMPGQRRTSRARLAYPIGSSVAATVALGDRAFIWKPGGGEVSIALASRVSGDSTATLTWADGAPEEILAIPDGTREVRFSVSGTGWRFGRLAVESGQQAKLAVYLEEGLWAPFESSLALDLDQSGFRCGSTPQVLTIDASGQLLVQPEVRPEGPRMQDGEVGIWRVELRSATHFLPLIMEPQVEEPGDGDEHPTGGDGGQATPPDDGDGGDGSDPGDDPDSGPDGDGGDEDEPQDDVLAPNVQSVAHARLNAARSSTPGSSRSSFAVVADAEGRRTGIITTPARYNLAPQRLSAGLDGLELEELILRRPETLAFTVVRDLEQVRLEPQPYLEQLVTSGVSGFQEFLQTRAALFGALAGRGSAHAIAAGTAVDKAIAYVEAYSTVLHGVMMSGRFSAEHERIFLCDAVEDPATGEVLIAPTSPLSIAYLLAMTDQFEDWLPRAADVRDEDLTACTIRHLVPNFYLKGTYYQVGSEAPLLWRRYRPQSAGGPIDHKAKYISQRIEHFLKVHPEYRDRRQVLSLALHEPGDGTQVLSALRVLARRQVEGALGYDLPRLKVVVVSDATARTAIEDLVTGSIAADGPDRLLQDRLQVSKVMPQEEGNGEVDFAHLSFVFESKIHREQTTVGLGDRASTLYAGGLAAVPGRHIVPGQNETTFTWGTFTGSQPGDDRLSRIVSQSLELVGGMPRDVISSGRTRMPSLRVAREFLEGLYRGSAWVVHLDRLLGLEAFAPDATGRHARYLIDYADRLDVLQPGLDAITATNRIEPYRRALRRSLAEFGRPTEPGLDAILRLFNSVSGQWALDLVGANPVQLRERVGLAAAVASIIDLDGGLHGTHDVGVVVPIDEVLAALPRRDHPTRDVICDDLLYLRVPIRTNGPVEIRARIIEVKYRSSTEKGLAEHARQQLERTRRWLDSTFNDRGAPGHMFRSRDMAELIRGAATRSSAFQTMSGGQRTSLESALGKISAGSFQIRFDYRVGKTSLHGDFVSLEVDSSIAVHRQQLPGTGLPLGHLRLGQAALSALVSGQPMPRPDGFPTVSFEGGPDGDGGTDRPNEPSRGDGPDATSATGPGADSSDQQVTSAGMGGRGSTPVSTVSEGSSDREPASDAAIQLAEVPIFAARLDAAFAKYGMDVEPFRPELAQVGPSLVRFRTRGLGRLSISDVERRARDIGREIAAPGQVLVGDAPGFITVDVPRSQRAAVSLAEVLTSLDHAPGRPGALNFVAGVAPSGQVEIADLSRLPHLLVAGATGSGKSVFLRGLLVELLRARTPEQLGLVIVDPKRLDFAAFARAPHLRTGIISDPDEALQQLQSILETELELRQPVLAEAGVSSAAEFYETGGRLEDLPQLVIMIDEFADLVLAGSDRRAFSEMIQRYAQLTRAYGIFLVLATQRPSVDVITGSIKANLSARIAFSLPSATDSRTVLDRGGAEDLLGDGDLLFYRSGRIERLQAAFTSAADVRIVLG